MKVTVLFLFAFLTVSKGSANVCTDYTTSSACSSPCNWDGMNSRCCDQFVEGACPDPSGGCSAYTQFSECQSPCEWDGYDCCNQTVNGLCPSSGSTETCSDYTTTSACSSPCNWDGMNSRCCDQFVEGACPDPSGGSEGATLEEAALPPLLQSWKRFSLHNKHTNSTWRFIGQLLMVLVWQHTPLNRNN